MKLWCKSLWNWPLLLCLWPCTNILHIYVTEGRLRCRGSCFAIITALTVLALWAEEIDYNWNTIQNSIQIQSTKGFISLTLKLSHYSLATKLWDLGYLPILHLISNIITPSLFSDYCSSSYSHDLAILDPCCWPNTWRWGSLLHTCKTWRKNHCQGWA